MKVEPIKSISTSYDLDGSEIYNTESGKTVSKLGGISFQEVLEEVLRGVKSAKETIRK